MFHGRQVNPEKPKEKISVAPSIKVFLFISFIVGFNFGITKNIDKSIRILIRCICFMFVTFITSLVLWSSSNAGDFMYFILALQYFLSYMSLELSKYNLYDLIKEVHEIEEDIIKPIERKVGAFATASYVNWFLIKCVTCLVFCYNGFDWCVEFKIPPYVICSLNLHLDGMAVGLLLIQFYIYRCVKYLRELLNKEVQLEQAIKFYMSIADCYYKIMPLYGKLIMFELIANVPKIMTLMWMVLKGIKYNEKWMIGQGVFILHVVTQLCGPATVAEWTNSELSAIRSLLNDRMVIEKDQEQKQQISRWLQYINLYNLRYQVCRVIPVDYHMLAAVFSIITTYFVVVIQFTHLY